MAPRKKAVARKPAAPRPRARPRTQTKALAVTDAVRRQPLTAPLDRQLALVRAIVAWSPINMLVGQQAAFWEGFADRAIGSRRAGSPKRASRARPKTGLASRRPKA